MLVYLPTSLPTYIGKVCITIRSGGSGISFAVPLHCSIETGIGEAGFPPNRLPVFSCFASGKGRSIVEGLCCSDTNASVQVCRSCTFFHPLSPELTRRYIIYL